MPKYKRRKRLTERVAERQTGRTDEPERRTRRWAQIASQIGFAMSLVGLGLLAYEAMMVAQGREWDWGVLAVYIGLFIGGRLIKTALDTARPYL